MATRQRIDGTPKHGLRFNFHEGQQKAWDSKKRLIAILAGVRGGKTSFGPIWLYREMRLRGPGDYLIAAPSYPLLDKGARPEIDHFLRSQLRIGTLKSGPLRFQFSERGCRHLWGKVPEREPRILFGHADDPESLAAMQVKAAWLDEAGQNRFKLDSWEEIRRRLSIDQGRCLLTTTIYNLGWIKAKLYDPWIAAKRQHPDIDLIQFDSIMNPVFPREEYEQARRDLPAWKFQMFFRAQFERPAGMIYDCFDSMRHIEPAFRIPEHWERFVGLDFGGLNTAAVFFAKEPSNPPRYHAYREYWPRLGRTAAEHAEAMLKGEPRIPLCVGGAKSEGQWRAEFAAAGLPVHEPPISDVEVGINRVYGMLQREPAELVISDSLEKFRDHLTTYSREVDEAGEPTEMIEDKEDFHLCDAARYFAAWVQCPAWDATIRFF